LNQQRRWARSVLDLKVRGGGLGRETPGVTRVMQALHGLNYLQPAFFLTGGMWLLVMLLATARVPAIVAAIAPAHAALLLGAMGLCHFYRQRFFLDPAHEGGIHWRTRVMRLAKAPFLLLAMVDVIRGHKRAYEITSKVKKSGTPARPMVVAFAPVAALIAAAWMTGALGADSYPLACHVSGALALMACVGLMATDLLPTPAPFDARLIPDVG
jgi:hypothetical protein